MNLTIHIIPKQAEMINNAAFIDKARKSKLVRSVIFYSGVPSWPRSRHPSALHLPLHATHVRSEDERERETDSQRERDTETLLCVYATHSPAALMCFFFSSSINVTHGRQACKWRGA